MAKKNVLTVMLCLVLAFGFVAGSCTTTDVKSNMAGEYNLIPKIAGKDFVVLGLVSVKTQEVKKVSPLRLSTSIEGQRITYDLLLTEARTRHADVSDIINVRIDKVEKSKKGLFDFLTGGETTIEYYGNALAIRYTTAIQEGERPISGRRDTLPRGGLTGGGLLDLLPF